MAVRLAQSRGRLARRCRMTRSVNTFWLGEHDAHPVDSAWGIDSAERNRRFRLLRILAD